MADFKKSDCISFEEALKQAGVVKSTFNAYINALGVPKHKFPLDKRVYITKLNFERVKQAIEENKG
jgi:hypothetical protein